MECRVVRRTDGFYYPQRKRWFGWSYIFRYAGCIARCNTKEQAIDFIKDRYMYVVKDEEVWRGIV